MAERPQELRFSPHAGRVAAGTGWWNRLALEVDDLPSVVAAMKKEGFRFRNEIETGPGGKQIQLEDPDPTVPGESFWDFATDSLHFVTDSFAVVTDSLPSVTTSFPFVTEGFPP
jgi:hypothetical protein